MYALVTCIPTWAGRVGVLHTAPVYLEQVKSQKIKWISDELVPRLVTLVFWTQGHESQGHEPQGYESHGYEAQGHRCQGYHFIANKN